MTYIYRGNLGAEFWGNSLPGLIFSPHFPHFFHFYSQWWFRRITWSRCMMGILNRDWMWIIGIRLILWFLENNFKIKVLKIITATVGYWELPLLFIHICVDTYWPWSQHSQHIVANPPAFCGRLPHFELAARRFPHYDKSPTFLPHTKLIAQMI